MTIRPSLIWAIEKLNKNKVVSPALDAEILLSFVIKKTKEFLFTHPEKKLTATELTKFKQLIARRAKHEPIAYITGHKFFYGLDFFVNKNVLIPRPDTELLVEEIIKSKILNLKSAIIDVGTGSGCIAVSLAHYLPGAKIFATEISPGALKVAKKNIKYHKVDVALLHGDLLNPIIHKIVNCKLKIENLLVVANLPYLTTRQWQKTQPEIKKYEPRQAFDGGLDGLKYYNQLLNQINLLVTRYSLRVTSIFEIDPSQTKPITKLIHQYFGKPSHLHVPIRIAKDQSFPRLRGLLRFCDIKKDLAGRDRLVTFDI